MSFRLTTVLFVAMFSFAIFAEEKQNVILISIDGLRDDHMTENFMPNVTKRGDQGIRHKNTESVIPPKTIPAHASMLTGLIPLEHGVLNNSFDAADGKDMTVKTLFDLIKEDDTNSVTAALMGKDKIRAILSAAGSPDQIDYIISPMTIEENGFSEYKNISLEENESAEKTSTRKLFNLLNFISIREESVKILKEEIPRFMFIHFADVDASGHFSSKMGKNILPLWNRFVLKKASKVNDKYPDVGWGSAEYKSTVKNVDAAIERIIQEVEKKDPGLKNTTIIITADHGGHGYAHGVNGTSQFFKSEDLYSKDFVSTLNRSDFEQEDLDIPWVAFGGKAKEIGLPSKFYLQQTFGVIKDILDLK